MTEIELARRDIGLLDDYLRERGIKAKRDTLSLELPPDLSYEDFEIVMRILGFIHKASQFFIGDALNFGELAYEDDKYVQAAALTELEPGSLKTYAWVARSVPPSRRHPGVRFSHHMDVAALPPEDQTRWLQRAADEHLTRIQLQKAIKGEIPEELQTYEICECCKRPL